MIPAALFALMTTTACSQRSAPAAPAPEASVTEPTTPAPTPIALDLPTEPVKMSPVAIPADLPYTRWRELVDASFLRDNDYAEGREGWRAAAGASIGVFRVAAYHLLARAPDAADAELLRRGLDDEDGAARAWAAGGLTALGEDHRAALRAEAARPLEFATYGPVVAAGLLAELGDPSGFPVIAAAMERDELRTTALSWLPPFAALEGQALEGGGQVDPWPLYRAGMVTGDDRSQNAVLAQLLELGDPRAAPIARDLLASNPGGALGALAEELLAAVGG